VGARVSGQRQAGTSCTPHVTQKGQRCVLLLKWLMISSISACGGQLRPGSVVEHDDWEVVSGTTGAFRSFGRSLRSPVAERTSVFQCGF
jgi:hypothetical protein